MRGASGLDKAHGPERGLVLDQLHPRLQLQDRQSKRPRPHLGLIDQAAGQTLPAVAGGHGQLANIKRPRFRRQEHTGHRCTDDPDFPGPCLSVEGFGRQIAQRRRRVDPALHEGKGLVEQGQDRRPEDRVIGKARRHLARV